MKPTRTSAQAAVLIAGLATILATGCAPQQQATIPPSPTGCYVVNRGLLTAAIYGRYSPAPCNVVNATQPRAVFGSVGGSGASQIAQPAPLAPLPQMPPLGGGGAWSMSGPGGAASGTGGAWSGAGPGWAGGGAGAP